MLTPCFDVTQDEMFIIISIRVPYAKISEAEFYIDGRSFKFYCKPYFLRLCLPGELVEDGRERAVHDIDKGTITVYVPKKVSGYHFENLGMITSLLSKKPSAKMPNKPLIEVLPGDEEVATGGGGGKEEEFDWQVEQQVPVSENEELSLTNSSSFYGFAEQQTAVFTRLQEELSALTDCPDPDHMSSRERRVARLAHEEASFDPDHYLADLMEGGELIESVCQFQPTWCQELTIWREKKSQTTEREPGQDIILFSDTEKQQLKELPNKEYLLDKAAERSLYLGLVDIMFAYAYDYRVTEGEHNVESAWTICKLSSTLSWLEVFRGSVGEVVYCGIRRSLCYPLYRHWELAQRILQDLKQLFLLGRRKLLQCLLAIKHILNSAEPYYVMNNLYITDYCVWIQRASVKQIQNLAMELEQLQIEKSSMGWELEELELAAHLVAAEDTGNTVAHSDCGGSSEEDAGSSDDLEGDRSTASSSDNRDTCNEGSDIHGNKGCRECGVSERCSHTGSHERLTDSERQTPECAAIGDTLTVHDVTSDQRLLVQDTVSSCDLLNTCTPLTSCSGHSGSTGCTTCEDTLIPTVSTGSKPANSDTIHSSRHGQCCSDKDCVAKLSEDLCSRLTLQPAPTTPHKKLIEELN